MKMMFMDLVVNNNKQKNQMVNKRDTLVSQQ